MMCWHKWTVKEKEILPSVIEQIGDRSAENVEAYKIGNKPCIVTYRCEKCGAEKVERV